MKVFLQHIFFFLSVHIVFGQNLNGFFKNYSTDNGLPSDRVLSVAQDKRGFMWFGTNDGLCRFDGYDFKVFYHHPNQKSTIASDNIFYLETSDDGSLWVGNYEAGLDRFDINSGKVSEHFDEANGLPDNRITYLYNDRVNQLLWIGVHQNMFCWYDFRLKKIIIPKILPKNVQTPAIPNKNSIHFIAPSKRNSDEFWIASNDGLFLYNLKTFKYEYFKFPESNPSTLQNRMRGIIVENDSTLWIGSRGGGILEFNHQTKSWKNYKYSNNKSENLIVQILPKSATEFWLATWDNSLGVFNTETKKFAFYKNNPAEAHSILPLTANRLFYDSDKNLWACMASGICQMSQSFQYFPVIKLPKPQIASSAIIFEPMSFADDAHNIYIAASAADGLLVMNKESKKVQLKRPKGLKPDESLTCVRVSVAPDGNVWVAAYNRLLIYNPRKDQIEFAKLPACVGEQVFHSVSFDKLGNIYLGTRENGLIIVDKKTKECQNFTKKEGLLHQRFIHELFFDSRNQLWITTERGISVMDLRGKKVVRSFSQSEGFKVIYRITEDINGVVWVSTENRGVIGINAESLKVVRTIGKEDGLPSNAIQHLAADKIGNLWIATQQGLCQYNLQNRNITIYDKHNGLIDNHLQGSLNILKDGTLVQGFKGSFTNFDPNKIIKKNSERKVLISDFYIFDNEQPLLSSDLHLSYKQNFFGFTFTNLDFENGDKARYAYKLEGIDTDWMQLPPTKRTTSYTNLKGGSYVLRFKESQNKKFEEIHIFIEPPFWQTWWFYSLCILGISGLIYGIYRFKISQVKREEAIKTEMNKQLANSEMKALRSQMNPHFIFNSLNSIKYYILQNDSEIASKYLNQFSKLIRQILNNSQQDFISLADEIESLKLYLEMEVLRFGGKVRYEFKIAENIDSELLTIPTMIIQPFIENAIWHGLMHKEKGGNVKILIETIDESQLKIIVEDDGVGRKKAAELKSKSATKSKSLGLKITEERVRLLNQNYDLRMNVEIEDLLDNQAVAQGTRVIITFKVRI